jgi:hypothetical protein
MEEEKRTEAEPKKRYRRREALKRIAKVESGRGSVCAWRRATSSMTGFYYDYYDYYSAYSRLLLRVFRLLLRLLELLQLLGLLLELLKLLGLLLAYSNYYAYAG